MGGGGGSPPSLSSNSDAARPPCWSRRDGTGAVGQANGSEGMGCARVAAHRAHRCRGCRQPLPALQADADIAGSNCATWRATKAHMTRLKHTHPHTPATLRIACTWADHGCSGPKANVRAPSARQQHRRCVGANADLSGMCHELQAGAPIGRSPWPCQQTFRPPRTPAAVSPQNTCASKCATPHERRRRNFQCNTSQAPKFGRVCPTNGSRSLNQFSSSPVLGRNNPRSVVARNWAT